MAQSESFDPIKYKEQTRAEWESAAAGWRKWYDLLETEEGGQRVSATLVQRADIGPGDAVLDVAGGYGEPALAAARAVGPDGRVVCTDISAAMLDFGRERATEAGLDNVEFTERDAEELDFETGRFDAILSRFGLMFLPDVRGTLERLYAFLAPDGRFAASVWGPQPKVEFAAAAPVVFEELGLPPPPPGRPGLFALADSKKLAALVADAGFQNVETGTLTVVYEGETPEQFTQNLRDCVPAITNVVEAQPPDVQARVWEKVTKVGRQFLDADGRVRTENEAIWVTGIK